MITLNVCRAQIVQGLDFEILVPGDKGVTLIPSHVVSLAQPLTFLYITLFILS